MAKQITQPEVYQADLWDAMGKNAIENLKKLDQLDDGIIRITKNLKDMLSVADPNTQKGLTEIFTVTEKINTQAKRTIDVEKQKVANQKVLQKMRLEEIRLEKAREKSIDDYNKKMEKAAKIAAEAARPYKQLEKALNDAKRKYQDLAAAGLAETAAGRAQLKVVTDLRTKYEGLNKSIGNNQFAVGRYKDALGPLGQGLKGIIGLLGQLGFALGGVALATRAIKTLRDFDEGAADVAKTLNITKDEARGISEELLKIDTRSSVAELQKIAAIGGQLGVAKNDIIAFTQATDKLNVALGDEFTGGAEEITAVIGGLRNVFGDIKTKDVDKDLLNIGNALNVLGAEGAATAPVVSDFAGRIGGVGIPLGLTTDEVLGLSATLQELNVNAERGGTATTKVLQKITTNTKDFAKLAGMDLKEFETLVNEDIYGAFIKVVEGSKKFGYNSVELGKILDKLGLDGAGTSEVFLKLGENTAMLDEKVKLAGKSLKETDSITNEFNTKNNTLSANVEKLSKAWDTYIISADSATGASSFLSHTLGTIANNLPRIIGLIIKIAASYGIYRVALIAVNIQQDIAQKGAKGYAKELFSLKKNSEDAGKSASGMGSALKGIAWTAIITLALQAAAAIYDIASGAAEVRAQAKAMADAKEAGEKRAGDSNSRTQKEAEERIRLLDIEQRKRIANGENEEAVIKQITQRKKQAYEAAGVYTRKEIELEEGRLKKAEANAKRANKLAGDAKSAFARGGYSGGSDARKATDQLTRLAEQMGVVVSWEDDYSEIKAKIINQTKVDINQSETTIAGLKEYNKELIVNVDELATQAYELDKSNKFKPTQIEFDDKSTKAKKENTTALRANNDGLERSLELQMEERRIRNEIENITTDQGVRPVRDAQQNELVKQRESIANNFDYTVDELERLVDVEFNIRKDAAKRQSEFDKETLRIDFETERALAIEAKTKERDELLKQAELTAEEREKIEASYQQRIQEINSTFLENERIVALQREKIELELNKNLEAIDDERNARINEINDELFDLQVTANAKTNDAAEKNAIRREQNEVKYFRLRLLRTKKTQEEIDDLILKNDIERLEKQIALEISAGHESIDLELELEEKRRQLKDKSAAKDKKRLEDLKEFGDNLLKEGLADAKAASEKREALIDKEIEASQKLADALREQEATGNASAEESLAVQDEITNKKLKQKEREQREQEFIEDLRLLYEATNQYLQKGDSLPIAAGKAFTQVKGIKAIFSTLKGFFGGTKGRLADEDKAIMPGKDGHLIRADGSEAILTGEKMDRLEASGINTTDEIVANAIAFKKMSSGAILPHKIAPAQRDGNDRLIKEIRDLKSVIKSKKEVTWTAEFKRGLINAFIEEEKTPTQLIRTRHQRRGK